MSLLIKLSSTAEVSCSLQGRLLVIHYGQDPGDPSLLILSPLLPEFLLSQVLMYIFSLG